MKEHMKLLGLPVRDSVTGFEGVVTSLSFDLYGCVQAIVTPPSNDKGDKIEDSRWFDTKRLKVRSDEPVVPVPTFEGTTPKTVTGGFDKPLQRQS